MEPWAFRMFMVGAGLTLAGTVPMIIAGYGAIFAHFFFGVQPFDSPWLSWPFWGGAALVAIGWPIGAGAMGGGLLPKAPPPPPMPEYILPDWSKP